SGDLYSPNTNEHTTAYETAASAELRYSYANSNAPAGGALTPGAANFTGTANTAGAVRFTATNYTVVEHPGPRTVSVQRIDNDTGALTVTVHAVNGTAQNGDWGNGTGTQDFSVSWLAGEGGVKTFTIPISDTAGAEGKETVALSFTAGAFAQDTP